MRRKLGLLLVKVIRKLFPLAVIAFKKSPQIQNLVSEALGIRSQVQLSSDASNSEQKDTVVLSSHFVERLANSSLPEVTIVVAVHGAYEATQECLTSVMATLPAFASLLVIDDASESAEIDSLLETVALDPRVTVVRNEKNLGYTRTVNLAFRLTDGKDVVLLNSDTVVPKRWLETLRFVAYSQANVATVTPVSDNSGVFSVPSAWGGNVFPRDLEFEDIAKIVQDSGRGESLNVPTGNGFCLFIRREALDEIGFYDEVRFPRGYGEENDFCMRAVAAGWLNKVTDKVFVAHKTSQSFGEEKNKLMKTGGEQILALYPDYDVLVSRFHDKDFQDMRSRVEAVWTKVDVKKLKKRLLVINPIRDGGLEATSQDLINGLAEDFEIYFFESSRTSFAFGRFENENKVLISLGSFTSPLTAVAHSSTEYDAILAGLLFKWSIEFVHVEHMAWQSTNVFKVCKSMGIRSTLSLHDFYTLCASHHLLDGAGKSCKSICTVGETPCTQSFWPTQELSKLKNLQVNIWRNQMWNSVSLADAQIAPSEFVARRIGGAVPEKLRENLLVVEHGRELSLLEPRKYQGLPGERLRVLIPGNIGTHKGSKLIAELIELDSSRRKFEFHFLGLVDENLLGKGIQHGTYERRDFNSHVSRIKPHIGLVLSVAEETFCHTLTELWAAGLPVVGTDLGAVGQRLGSTKAGWLIPEDFDAEEIYKTLESLVANSQEIIEKQQFTLRWQRSKPVELDRDLWINRMKTTIAGTRPETVS